MDFNVIVIEKFIEDRIWGRELESVKRNSMEVVKQKKFPRRGNILILSLLKVDVGVWAGILADNIVPLVCLQGCAAGL